ncbi:MAG: OmpA family protein [Terracidiphilus sp.]|jgi:outer membrane protein OmpA-like peptidoglycan-associated protein
MTNHRFGYVLTAAALTLFGVTGCATKNYVRQQTQPLVDHTDQLGQKTADNNRALHDVDERATAGIQKAQGSADTANQNAQNANQAASQADMAANNVAHRADSLDSVVKGLDNFKQVAAVSVTFGFDKAALTPDDKQQLDAFAGQMGSAKSYILEVTGGTDSSGPAQYNYDLSNRRADAVVQYLVTKYNVAPRRFYLIGIGKDQYVADNKTADGRKQNRRVQVQLLSNLTAENGPAPQPTTGQAGAMATPPPAPGSDLE